MKLSIIIPVYNEINQLERFTENLTSSFKYQNVEYIFVNDGSNDGSKEWLENYKKNQLSIPNEKKFIFINLLKNMGKGAALRKGLEVITGDYVLFLQIFIAEKKSGSVSFSLIFEMLDFTYFSSTPFLIRAYLILFNEYPLFKKALAFD